jgi:hypothetical protein
VASRQDRHTATSEPTEKPQRVTASPQHRQHAEGRHGCRPANATMATFLDAATMAATG